MFISQTLVLENPQYMIFSVWKTKFWQQL